MPDPPTALNGSPYTELPPGLKGLKDIPLELRELPQWVGWRLESDSRGKPAKKPYQGARPTQLASTTDPSTWCAFEQAIRAAADPRNRMSGIGFVFSKDDPYAGIDFDKCIEPDGTIGPWQEARVDGFQSYTERSQSGTGLHIIVRGKLPAGGRKLGQVECYDHARFFVVTGDHLPGTPATIEDRDEELKAFYREIFPEKQTPANGELHEPKPNGLTDQEILEKAQRGSNHKRFNPLWQGDLTAYDGDWSRADLALCSDLAFWSGGDAATVDRLFRLSGLFREKWDERRGQTTYGERTIARAFSGMRNFYQPGPRIRLRGDAERNGHHDQQPSPAENFAAEQLRLPLFLNYQRVATVSEGKEVEERRALAMAELVSRLDQITGGWPKAVADTLFVPREYKPLFLETASEFFAWLSGHANIVWGRGQDSLIPQDRFFEFVRRHSAERFDSIEAQPHWPPLPRIFYLHPEVKRIDNPKRLFQLLDCFCPATDVDRSLMLSFILTLFWGGAPGARPAFLGTGISDDEGQGRGIGKTAFFQVISDGLEVPCLDVSANDDMDRIKTRLLSVGAGSTRIGRLDNVKTLRFSWGDFEALVTASIISGHAMYRGEGKRPNLLTWVITLNGANLSKDMAQRVIPIWFARPKYAAAWESDVRAIIREHRQEILGEIRGLLEAEVDTITPTTRWAPWEQGVLSRCGRVEECQSKIIERQDAIDDDNEERDIVRNHFKIKLLDVLCLMGNREQQLEELDRTYAVMSSQTAAVWLGQALNKQMAVNSASAKINSLGIRELMRFRDESFRGFLWRGCLQPPTGEEKKKAKRVPEAELRQVRGS